VVSSAMESVLGCLPDDVFHVEVVGELVIEFQNLEERSLCLEWPTIRIGDKLLGSPPNRE
jgi:hypothetical protein